MIVLDWRGARAEVVAPVFEQERQRWLQALQWDSTKALREVEQARTTWGLPGLIAVDDSGRAIGSLFYLADRERFEIGGVTAETPAVTAALLDRVVDRAVSDGVEEVRCFVYNGAPDLDAELGRRGFQIEPYRYLSGAVTGGTGTAALTGDLVTKTWQHQDVPAIAALLREAYGIEDGRLFAPHGRVEEWERYLRTLVEFAACGQLIDPCSLTVWQGGRLLAVAVVTAIAPQTAHLAQFAVHPSMRGSGLARGLLSHARGLAAQQGFNALTLLVADGNVRARRLYESLGMVGTATFLAARGRPAAA